jgi:glutathione S-transferase
MKSSVPILVTFPVSHFCEKARWALQFFNVEFEEAAHAPPFHRSAARGTVPALLIDESRRILGSDAIVEFAKSNATKNESAAKKPAPDAARLATMDELGVRTRQWAYFYILQDRALALDQLAPIDGVPSNERWWLSWSMWALVPLMRSGTFFCLVVVALVLNFVVKD